jgi:spore maturation protein CgeB
VTDVGDGPSLNELRVSYICRYVPGVSEILRSMLNGLKEIGCQVQFINLTGKPSYLYNPERRLGGHGPVYVRLSRIWRDLERFRPHAVIACAGGLTFESGELEQLKRHAAVIGITLSDPDVFPTVSEYSHRFDVHTTNALKALELYRERKHENIRLMPFAVDRSYFEPRDVSDRLRCDAAVIGHARMSRLALAARLAAEFDVRFYGKNWPHNAMGPVSGEAWLRAAYSTRCLINFPGTGAGHTNVKVGVFEAAATGRLLFTQYFDEMRRYFDYDTEIIGYRDEEELVSKLRYYIAHEEEAERIAKAGQRRCLRDHLWSKRFAELLGQMDWSALSGRRWFQE